MNARRTLNFEGTITAVTPITVTCPQDEESPKKDKKHMLPRLGPKLEQTQAYVEGRTLRGVLRHSCLDIIARVLRRQTGQDKVLTVQQIYMLAQGVDCSNKVIKDSQKFHPEQEAALREENPALSLFGRWDLTGHLNVGPLIPTVSNHHCVYIAGTGVRTNVFQRDPRRVEFLDDKNLALLKSYLQEDSQVAALNGATDQAIKEIRKKLRGETSEDAIDQLKAELERLETQKRNLKQSKSGAQETIQRPLPGFEAFRPGTVFHHKMAIENGNLYEIGLALAVLREVAKFPRIGGHRAECFGEFMAEWTVTSWHGDEDEPTTHGKVRMGLNRFEILEEPGSTLLSDALNAWTKATAQKDCPFNFTRYLLDESEEEDITDGSRGGRRNREKAA